MQILIDIVHPADVLFFLRPIRLLEARGHKVDVISRHKDVTCALLDRFGIPHTPLSRQGRGALGLGAELIGRDARLLGRVRRHRPDVMLGFGGVAIAQVGWLTRIPSLVVYDSENARLQTRLAWPFLTRLIVPEDYAGPVPAARTERLPGTKDLSYFHPSAFRPDPARAPGLDPDRANIFLRTVRWGANHDIGKSGWTDAQAQALVDALTPWATLHVSAEGTPPPALAPYLWQGDPAEVHHLLGCCDGYVGESATMACEAVTMGVPALYAGVDLPGYVAGLVRRGLIDWVPPSARDALPARALDLREERAAWQAHQATWIRGMPDWAEAVANRAEDMACG